MQKVYLLLRNNQQTGPHSFEELLQLQLKPFDLVWIEGKSYGWRYPAEVEALKPYFENSEEPKPGMAQQETIIPERNEPTQPSRNANPVSPKNVFVSMPVNARPQSQPRQSVAENFVDPIEQKAEELRKRAQAFTPRDQTVKTNYTRQLNEAEEEYTQWIYEKKTKRKNLLNKKQLTIAGAGVVLLTTGLWLGNYFFYSTPVKAEVKAQAIEQASLETPPSALDRTSNEENVSEKNIVTKGKMVTVSPPETIYRDKSKKKDNIKTIDKGEIAKPKPAIMQNEMEPQPTGNTVTKTNNEPAAEGPAEKKKSFKEKIGELFKKSKANEPVVADEGSRGTDNSNNERKATRRGEDPEPAPAAVDVSNQVDVKTNKIADSWMIGVKNLKLTLFNRSNLTINAATVEVLYYSEQNNLLDKKILSFSNIPPKKSQTVSAPDMRLADHVDYKVISASAIENAYAKQ